MREKRAQETCLKIYLSDDEAGAKQYAALRTSLENLKARDEEHAWGRLVTETALTRQEDWEWGWKQYFKPFPVGHSFMIKPSWETVDDAQGRRILEIDPASSFGTGSHDTTQLCMCALEDNVKPGDTVLDMGTGSGILAIAAAMLGAEVKTVVDIDENCLRTAQENAEKNHVTIGRACAAMRCATKSSPRTSEAATTSSLRTSWRTSSSAWRPCSSKRPPREARSSARASSTNARTRCAQRSKRRVLPSFITRKVTTGAHLRRKNDFWNDLLIVPLPKGR